MRTVLGLALVVVMGIPATGEQPRKTGNPCVVKGDTNPLLRPVDDAPSTPDFLQYRARLQMAAERRDVDAVIEASDPGIRLGFSDASGGTKALRMLLSEQPALWNELRLVLAKGVWAHVQLGDGRTGYIWDAFVRSPVNYRAFFNLIDGRWRMTAFLEGD